MEYALSERTVRKCFSQVKASEYNLEYQELSGMFSTTDKDTIKMLIEKNSNLETDFSLFDILKTAIVLLNLRLCSTH